MSKVLRNTIPFKQVRTSQPKTPVSIDWSNPITRGLEFVYLPGLPSDSSKKIRNLAVFGSGVSSRGSSLTSIANTASSGLRINSGKILGGLSNSTVLGVAETNLPTGTGNGYIENNARLIYCERSNVGNCIYKLGIGNYTGLKAEFTYRNAGGTLLQQRLSDTTLNDGRPKVYFATKNGTTHGTYVSGIGNSGTIGSADTTFTDSGIEARIASDKGDVNGNWGGLVHLVAGWSRALSAAEIKSLSANPWQIFQPIVQQIPYDMVRGPMQRRESYLLGTTPPTLSASMPAAVRKQVWTSQPQTPVGIDWTHPAAPDMGLWLPSLSKTNLVTNIPCTDIGTGVQRVTTKDGIAYATSGQSAMNFFGNGLNTGIVEIPKALTLFVMFEATDAPANGYAGVLAKAQYGLYWDNSNSASRAAVYVQMDNSVIPTVQLKDVSLNRSHSVVMVWNGLTIFLFQNGVFCGETGAVGTLKETSTTPLALLTGNYSSLFPAFNGKILVAGLKRYAVNPSVAQSLSKNPWQIFAPLNKPVWVPV